MMKFYAATKKNEIMTFESDATGNHYDKQNKPNIVEPRFKTLVPALWGGHREVTERRSGYGAGQGKWDVEGSGTHILIQQNLEVTRRRKGASQRRERESGVGSGGQPRRKMAENQVCDGAMIRHITLCTNPTF